MSTFIDQAKRWARRIKRDVVALWIAARDKRTPVIAKVAAACVAAYALSPVDLIGYLDDLLIVPLGILLAVMLIPAPLLVEFRVEASRQEGRPASRLGLAVVVLPWVLGVAGRLVGVDGTRLDKRLAAGVTICRFEIRQHAAIYFRNGEMTRQASQPGRVITRIIARGCDTYKMHQLYGLSLTNTNGGEHKVFVIGAGLAE